MFSMLKIPFRLLFAIFLLAISAYSAGASAQSILKKTNTLSAVVQTEQVRAELIAHAPDGVGVGKTVWLGLQIQHQPHWHTYWINPGESGLATTLQWTLPAKTTAGAIVWPTPQRMTIGSMVNYGYSDTVLLPVPLTIEKGFTPSATSDVEVRLSASWLVCRQECVPQDGQFVLTIPAQGSTASHGADFDAAHAASPKPLEKGSAQAKLVDNALTVEVQGLPADWNGKTLQVFAETLNIVEPATATQPSVQAWNNGVWSATLPLSVQREGTADSLPLVVVNNGAALRTVASIGGTWPALPNPNAPSPSATSTTPTLNLNATPQGFGAWLWAIGAALLGGLILNLMPCVLPVLAIKVLNFSQHRESIRMHRLEGLAYTAGVVLSFMALGALMLALRAAGEQLGWGFQLQSPPVVAGLAVLFTLLGLNLAGLFEVGNLLPQSLAALESRHPVVDAFISGMVAVAIASPCTAPFMGASLGYAIALPAAQALGIFAALGIGLALPFLLVAWVPGIERLLPRPGAWMVTLRSFLAFPMLATVIWLVWVLGHLNGVDGAAALLGLLLVLAWVVWSLNLTGRSRTVFATISIASFVLLAGAIGNLVVKSEDGVSAVSTWQAWTPEKVNAELAANRPVFVDFTAAWCITCQYNKKTTLANAEVLADMKAKNITLFRADWTHRDPTITRALEQLGRNGVPVYVLYQSGKNPVVFSEILDVKELRAAVAGI
jgi:thiol:disulfide interchange protein DsbD